MVEQAADEYIASAQRLLDLNVKDWSDDDWGEWQNLINIFRRVKSETLNNVKPYQKLFFDSMNRYFAIKVPFDERQKFETEPHNFDATNFILCSEKHSTIIEPAVTQLLTYQGEVNKHLHRLFPIIRLHQKGIQGLLERLFESNELNTRLEQENGELRAELEETKAPAKAKLREPEEELPEFKALPKKKKGKAYKNIKKEKYSDENEE